MPKTVYEQFDAAFDRIDAYVITTPHGVGLARIAIKYPRDGMGRANCYAQVWGAPMVHGSASGCGYDKRGAAISSALSALERIPAFEYRDRPGIARVIKILAAIGLEHDQWSQICKAIESYGWHVQYVFG